VTAPSSTLDRRSQLEKTLEVHLQELREQIAQEIEQVAKENDTQIIPLGIALSIARDAK
jgi:hypothetical protein